MNERDTIAALHRYGHFANPDKTNANNVTDADIDTLRLSDKVVEEAVASYQEFFKPTLDDLVLKHHRTRMESIADGDMGPATTELLFLPRCGVPEFGVSESANWPTSCRNPIRTDYKMSLSGLSDGELANLWDETHRIINGALADARLVRTPVKSNPQAEVEIYAKGTPLPGSTLAWSHLARSVCNATLDQRYDSGIRWSGVSFVSTAVHELLHALGCGHLRDSQATMYPQITQATKSRRGFPNASDLRQLQNLGYLIAADPKPEPKDPGPGDPPKDDKRPAIAGRITIDGHECKLIYVEGEGTVIRV